MERVEVELPSGARVSYLVGGAVEAPPVVLLHGGGIDHALLSWGPVAVVLLQSGFRVILPDHPGYGQSQLPLVPVTMDYLADYLAEFIDTLGLRAVALVGISMGGAMALRYTLAASTNVRSLALVGSYGLQHRAPAHLLSFVLVRVPGLAELAATLVASNRWLLKQSARQIVRNEESLTPALLDEMTIAATHPRAGRAFAQFQRDEIRLAGLNTNLTARLHEIEQPVLLVHGSRDVGVPVAAARDAARVLPHARLEIIDGAGHWTQRDQPARFAELLLDHLRASDGR